MIFMDRFSQHDGTMYVRVQDIQLVTVTVNKTTLGTGAWLSTTFAATGVGASLASALTEDV